MYPDKNGYIFELPLSVAALAHISVKIHRSLARIYYPPVSVSPLKYQEAKSFTEGSELISLLQNRCRPCPYVIIGSQGQNLREGLGNIP